MGTNNQRTDWSLVERTLAGSGLVVTANVSVIYQTARIIQRRHIRTDITGPGIAPLLDIVDRGTQVVPPLALHLGCDCTDNYS